MSFVYFSTLITLFPLLVSSATNDWSKPCLQGWCSYDIQATENTMAASMIITGSSSSISDITTAAGWEIIGCNTTSSAQDIRLVCTGDEASCSHIFESGAEHTIVRLPEDCTSAPFAHVASAWVSENQTLPDHLQARLLRRDGTTPTVHALSLNTNFSQAANSSTGDVSLFITGSNVPGFAGNATQQLAGSVSSRRRSRVAYRRSLFSDIFSGLSSITSEHDLDKNVTLTPIDVDQSFNLFNTSVTCDANTKAQISVDVHPIIHTQVTLGIAAKGRLVPPSIDDFGVFAALTADLEGSLDVNADIAGTLDTGNVALVTIPISGFSIPDILDVGPSISVNGRAVATVDLDMDLTVNMSYSVSNLELFFPPSEDHTSSADVSPNDTPLKLSVSPDVSTNTTLEAHLIPSLNVGLSAFGKLVSASVFLDLDTSATLDLGLEANATAAISTNGTKSASGSVDGCVDLKAGVGINVGAEGSFFGLFDPTAQLSLFQKDFDLFQKCFSESAATKRELGLSTRSPLAKRDFTCNPGNITGLVSTLIDDIVSASSLLASSS